jgi:uncharacterized membrane protein
MNTYDDLVNDYLRAVEEALAGVPAGRRDELLADLSQHIAAKRAELSPDRHTEVEVRTILELLGDPAEVAAEAMIDAEPSPPILIQPPKKLGALIWVLLMIGAIATLCVAAGLAGVLLFARGTSGGPGDSGPAPVPTTLPAVTATPTPSAS